MWGAAAVVVAKLVDYYASQGDRARAEREELRAEIKRARDERDEEARRRRDAEADLRKLERAIVALRTKSYKLVDERDSAENGSHLAREAAEKALTRMREAEGRASECEREVAALRQELAERDRTAWPTREDE